MLQARVLTVHEACQAHRARGWIRDQKCRGPRVRSLWSFAWGLAGPSPFGTSAFRTSFGALVIQRSTDWLLNGRLSSTTAESNTILSRRASAEVLLAVRGW